MKKINNEAIDYKYEVMRKSIHLASLSIPITYYFVTAEFALLVLVPLTLFSLTIDISRFYFPILENFLNRIFGFLMRDHEKDKSQKNLSGATYVLISAVFSIIVFPKLIFLLAFAVLILSDTAAALWGRRFGRHKFLFKSFEGTLAFFIVGCLIVFVTPKLSDSISEYIIAYIAIAVGAIAENVSSGWADDNLTVPISIGFCLWGLYYLIIPNLTINLSSPIISWFFNG